MSRPTSFLKSAHTHSYLSSIDNGIESLQGFTDGVEDYLSNIALQLDTSNVQINSGNIAVQLDDKLIKADTDSVTITTMPSVTISDMDTLARLDRQEWLNSNVEIVSGCVSGSELQVDVVTQPNLSSGSDSVSAVQSGQWNVHLSNINTIATESTLGTLAGNITKGSDSSLSDAQQVLIYGRESGGTLYPLQTTSTGILSTHPQHTWTTSTIINSVSVGASTLIYSDPIDFGANSHLPDGAMGPSFFLDLDTAISSYDLSIQSSPDGISWYHDAISETSNATSLLAQNTQFCLDKLFSGFGVKDRYLKIGFQNNDVSSVTVDLVAGMYL